MIIDISIDKHIGCHREKMEKLASRAVDALDSLNIMGATPPKESEMSLRIVDNASMQALNLRYRHIDRPTNVLALPRARTIAIPPDAPHPLGDIILAYPFIVDEARKYDKLPENHIIHLVIHALLHLLGYDHENEENAKNMENIEISALKTLSIDNPYLSFDPTDNDCGEK